MKLKRNQHGQYLEHESVLFFKLEKKNPDPWKVLKQLIKTELKIEKNKKKAIETVNRNFSSIT